MGGVWRAAEGSPTAGGSVWVSWSTGFYNIVPNLQAPSYPNATIYAPRFPDQASVASVVRVNHFTSQAQPANACMHAAAIMAFKRPWVPAAHCHDALRQVEWGLSAAGPFNNTAIGYARGYIQVILAQPPHLQACLMRVAWQSESAGNVLNIMMHCRLLPLQTYLTSSATFASSLLHHVHVTGIPYGTPIYYKCAHACPARRACPCLPPAATRGITCAPIALVNHGSHSMLQMLHAGAVTPARS